MQTTTASQSSSFSRLKRPSSNSQAPGNRQPIGSALVEVEPKYILFSVLLSLFLSPITFQLLAGQRTETTSSPLLSDLTASLVTLALCSIIIFLANLLLRHNCQHQLEQLNLRLRPKTLFSRVFYSPTKQYHDDDNNNNSRGEGDQLWRDAKSSPNKRKIDPKYFKPKFILNELMTMWGTTYTVITWGSVWVVGGTIIAGEKLAQKIKTKCTTPAPPTGQSNQRPSYCDSYASTSASGSDDNESNGPNNRSSLKRLSSWTRRSYASAKKKWSKFINAGTLQITTGSPRR